MFILKYELVSKLVLVLVKLRVFNHILKTERDSELGTDDGRTFHHMAASTEMILEMVLSVKNQPERR